MRRQLTLISSGQGRIQLVLAVLFGVTAGLFISGYWLTDVLPAESRLLVVCSVIAAVLAAALYYLIVLKSTALFNRLAPGRILRLAFVSALLAVFLFFAGTSQWERPGRYVGFWLPRQSFRLISIDAPAGTSIVWINTALGDVSYANLKFTGWVARGERLILQDPADGVLEWTGKTGDRVEMVFEGEAGAGDFDIQWGDLAERIRLGPGKSSYTRTFSIPFLASDGFVTALGLLNFWALTLAALVWANAPQRLVQTHARDKRRERTIRTPISPDILILGALILLATLLRAFNLGAAYPAVDEYYHLIAANSLVHGAALDSVYPRGLWIVTVPVALALRLFGHELWAARLMGVMFNVLALLPLYALARKISRRAAIVVGIMYATSPWVITFSRVAREYAYYPLYFYLIVLLMISLVEAIPSGCVVIRDWHRLLRPRIGLLTLGLVIPPVFAMRIDWLSTFRTILIAYIVLGIFVALRFDWRERANWLFLGAWAIAVGAAGWYFYREQLTKLLLVPRLNPVPLNYFFPNPPQQWYYDRVGLLMAISVAIVVVEAVKRRRSETVPAFFVCLFIAYLAVFALFSKTFYHTRHLISTQFWFVVVAGIGVCWLWEWLRARVGRQGAVMGAALTLVVALPVLNIGQILLPTLARDPDMPISEDYLHDMSAVQAYLLGQVHDGDALVSTVYGLYATWSEQPRFGNQLRINAGTRKEEIAEFVKEQVSGWIVIDSIRLDMSSLTERSLTELPQMEYIGSFGDEHVWRWGRPPAG